MIILHYKVTGSFRYIWLKYITGFNLNEHCAKSFIGEYSKVNLFKEQQDVDLNEHEGAKYFYLCGVAKPFRYKENFHLAFIHKPGSLLHVNRNGIEVMIQDAEEVEIKEQSFYDHEKGHLKTYNTCRNWRFAYQVVNKE